MKIAASVLGSVLALGLAGCGGEDKPTAAETTAPPSTPPASVGTVEGTLTMVGGPNAGTSIPVSGNLTIVGTGTSIEADIGEDGKFAIQLPPGSYRISATSPSYNNGGQCNTAAATTVITAGKTVTADILCQMR